MPFIEIEIDNTKVDADLVDFPFHINLSSSSGITSTDVTAIFDEIGSSSKKIKVTTDSAGLSQLFAEIESWNSIGEKATLHTKIPSILAASITKIYFWYDSTFADNTIYIGNVTEAPAQSVWYGNLSARYGMAQDPNGDVANAIKDSTSNVNHGTPVGSMVTGDLVSLLVNNGLNFNGSQAVSVPDSNELDMNLADMTLEMLIRGGDQSGVLVLDHRTEVTGVGYLILIDGSGKFASYIQYGAGLVIGGVSTSIIDDSTFHYITARFDRSGNLDLFIDGVVDGTYDISSQSGFNVNTVNTLEIARKSPAFATSAPFTGDIDEVRVSKNIALSNAWIKANYHSLFDTLGTYSSPVTPGPDEGILRGKNPGFPLRPEESIALEVTGGQAPFNWSPSDISYTMAENDTAERTNIITAPITAEDGDSVIVTVTDNKSDQVDLICYVCIVSGTAPGGGALGDLPFCTIVIIPPGYSGAINIDSNYPGVPPYVWEIVSGSHTLTKKYTNNLKNIGSLSPSENGISVYRITDSTLDYTECPIAVGACGTCVSNIGYTTLGMQADQQQTLTVVNSTGPSPCYGWEITAGGGFLSTATGFSTVYTAPSTNSGCADNPTIVLKCNGVTVDSIEISINAYTGGEPAWSYKLSTNSTCTPATEGGSGNPVWNCKTDVVAIDCQGNFITHLSVLCDGSNAPGCFATTPRDPGTCGQCYAAITCCLSGGVPLGGSQDLRTGSMVTDGCCPTSYI